MRKTYFDGTHRTRHPADTWTRVRPLLARYGITRIADVTGLDDIGIPVTMAVRPLARTLSVAQGKGANFDAARVSGAMEAIEAWHAERALPPVTAHQKPSESMRLPYPVTTLEAHPGSLLTHQTRLDWITGRSLTDGSPVPVPAAAVRIGREAHADWRMHLPSSSTNGLASGNTPEEAIVHALGEVIERDTISALADGHPHAHAQLIDPWSVDDPQCSHLIGRLIAAGAWFELWHLPTRFGVPVMACYLWREDQPAVIVSGSGAHLDPRVALSRAITEAAQSRLTLIAGTREDVAPVAYRPGVHQGPKASETPCTAWPRITDAYRLTFDSHGAEAAHLTTVITVATGIPPIAIDLTSGIHAREEFAVVKVLAPHLRYDSRHTIPRPGRQEQP
ncbi:YcaO-like family protein [Streptomyces sp. AP-93]|uniref:YcaO-like family protein n=1 Tax=Streptomyces sp. AP-93 TaxID=2929048 RepID=UPI001FAFF9B1|nr:YcaO-like family protein [Streptomyces sp. AP-93]MCJ0868088.1 YcaO-like family protein [Streptomyces sp. AP-93]